MPASSTERGHFCLCLPESAASSLDHFDVRLGIALILNQRDEIIALRIGGREVVACSDKETHETLEVIDTQTAISLDQLVQRRRCGVRRFHRKEQLDRVIADFLANHLLLVFTHRPLPPALQRAGSVPPSRARLNA